MFAESRQNRTSGLRLSGVPPPLLTTVKYFNTDATNLIPLKGFERTLFSGVDNKMQTMSQKLSGTRLPEVLPSTVH